MGWQYYGQLTGITDADVNALPVPRVLMPNTVDALFQGEGGIPLTGGGLVTQNDVKMALAKIAYKLYGLPLTRATILAVPLRYVANTDTFDEVRPYVAGAIAAAGAVLAPFSFGTSAAAAGLASKAIMANATQINSQVKAANQVSLQIPGTNQVIQAAPAPAPAPDIVTQIFNFLFGWL